MTTAPASRSIWIDNARIIAIFAVVLLHVAARFVYANPGGNINWWFADIYDAAVRWGVPVFAMVSGALLLDPGRQESLGTYYKKRVLRVAVPIVFWSVLYYFWGTVPGMLRGEMPPLMPFVYKLMEGTPFYHLWFLYMILGFYVFAPFIRKAMTACSVRELFVLDGLLFFFAAAHVAHGYWVGNATDALATDKFLVYLPYFIAGHLVKEHIRPPRPWILATIFVLSVTAAALGRYVLYQITGVPNELEPYAYANLSLFVIPMALSMCLLLRQMERPLFSEAFVKTAGPLTFGIYLIHPAIWDLCPPFAAVSDWLPPDRLSPGLSIPLQAVLVFTLSLAASWALSKIKYVNKLVV